MSLYRHVANKDELVTQMTDEVFGETEAADPRGPMGGEAKLERSPGGSGVCRAAPLGCRGHLVHPPRRSCPARWHTEWILRALDGLGLPAA